MYQAVKQSAGAVAINCLLLFLSLVLLTGVEQLLRNDKLLLQWYSQERDLFSSDVIHTLTHQEPRSFGHSSALSLTVDSKIHGKILARADLFSFSITGNLVSKRHHAVFVELFDSIIKSRVSNRTEDRVEACIKVSLALRGMDLNTTNTKDLFIHLPFQDNPPINVSLKIGDHFGIPPFSRCYIAMLTAKLGSCGVSKNEKDMHVDFEEFHHSKEPSRFQYVSTTVYQEALFFYLNQDLATVSQIAATSTSTSAASPKVISADDSALPSKLVKEASHLPTNAVLGEGGVELRIPPSHSLPERRHSHAADVFLYPNVLLIAAPRMDEKFPRHTEQVTVVMSVNTRVYSWLEQAQLPYSFTFILDDQRADVTEQIRPFLLEEYNQHIEEVHSVLNTYNQLLRSLTGEDLTKAVEGGSVRSMLSYFQLDGRQPAHISGSSSTALKTFTPVSLFINGDLPAGVHNISLEMWCQSSKDSQERELISSDFIRIHKL